MKNKEIEELLKGMRDVSNTEGCSMNLDRYLVSLLLSYIEQLENNRDKAIEYIEKHPCNTWYTVIKPNEDFREVKVIKHQEILLNILKGESDE